MGILYLDMFKWNRLHLYRKKFTERCISVFKTHSQSLAQVNTMHNALECLKTWPSQSSVNKRFLNRGQLSLLQQGASKANRCELQRQEISEKLNGSGTRCV